MLLPPIHVPTTFSFHSPGTGAHVEAFSMDVTNNQTHFPPSSLTGVQYELLNLLYFLRPPGLVHGFLWGKIGAERRRREEGEQEHVWTMKGDISLGSLGRQRLVRDKEGKRQRKNKDSKMCCKLWTGSSDHLQKILVKNCKANYHISYFSSLAWL